MRRFPYPDACTNDGDHNWDIAAHGPGGSSFQCLRCGDIKESEPVAETPRADPDEALRALNEGNVRTLLKLLPERGFDVLRAKLTIIADALSCRGGVVEMGERNISTQAGKKVAPVSPVPSAPGGPSEEAVRAGVALLPDLLVGTAHADYVAVETLLKAGYAIDGVGDEDAAKVDTGATGGPGGRKDAS